MSNHLLENIVWHSLDGSHAGLAVGAATTRRYARGYSPLFGFRDPRAPDLDALGPYCAPGEHLACSGWTGPVPSGWSIDVEFPADVMVWNNGMPAADPDLATVRLGAAHVPQMSALVEVTRPGPFAERTVEMGEFHGVFDGERLIAMAGERLYAHPWREVSGICTDPAYQGRGLARRLTAHVVRRQLLRGERPFLHVMRSNEGARRVYRAMGFEVAREVVIRGLARDR